MTVLLDFEIPIRGVSAGTASEALGVLPNGPNSKKIFFGTSKALGPFPIIIPPYDQTSASVPLRREEGQILESLTKIQSR